MDLIVKEGPGESLGVELTIAWAGLAMVHKATKKLIKTNQNMH